MWIMTTRGYYSVVEHRDDPSKLVVRARAKKDLTDLCKLPAMELHAEEIEKSPPGSDYGYRIWKVGRMTWATALVELTGEIEYDNFKNAIKEPRHRIYLDCWKTLRRIGGAKDPANRAIAHDRELLGLDPGAFGDAEGDTYDGCELCGMPVDAAGRCEDCGHLQGVTVG